MASLLKRGIPIQGGRAELLKNGVDEGLGFFNKYNESRLKLAFDNFTEDMRHALFEVLFLLHVNDRRLGEVKYKALRKDNTTGIPRYREADAQANLYLEGASSGVKGAGMFSPVFRDQMRNYIQETFGMRLSDGPPAGQEVVVCIQSIGSIGTIGHKKGASDLDLQVVYELHRNPEDLFSWDDGKFRTLLEQEHDLWMKHIARHRKLSAQQAVTPAIRSELVTQATQQVTQLFPRLYKYLVKGQGNYAEDLKGEGGGTLRNHLLHELMRLVKRATRISQVDEVREMEKKFKQRLARIQDYITDKFPKAEIYLFAMSLDMYRAGRYMSSLEFKESSGSAYELILNYETLMPGIQFTCTIPSHFVFPTAVNNDASLYDRLTDLIEFRASDIYQDVAELMVDLGHTPNLETEYVARHMPAAYWEAFKASSGNLPKALLNLFRFEMLIDRKFSQTIIQCIKDPRAINNLIPRRPGDAKQAEAELRNESAGVPPWALSEMEFDAPALLQDPWWLRYKALKVGFAMEEGIEGMEQAQRNQISRIVDLAFALHVRISDVFTKPGDQRTFDSHRDQVLVNFLEAAFPPGTKKRTFLEHIFSGDVQALNQFETELRAHFRWSLERTQRKTSKMGVETPIKKNKEVELWHKYYLEYFEPKPNVVQKTIMHHLKFPRGRLQIGYKWGEGWFFRSLQKQSSVGRRFDTFNMLDHLPDEVTLIEGSGFLHGLATCIVNGYYGILNRGSLKETRTALEFDAKHMDMGSELDNTKAFISPDYIARIVDNILGFFPYEYHHYLDFIRLDRKLDKIYLFLNLWHFGRLSILYRDNLNTWYCDEIDHPDLREDAEVLVKDAQKLLSAKSLHESFDLFMVNQRLFVDEVDLKTWVNPNSVEIGRTSFQSEAKERELSEMFLNEILKSHPKLNRAK